MIEELRKFQDLEKKTSFRGNLWVFIYHQYWDFFFLCVDACCLVKGSGVINRRKEKEKEKE